MKSSLRPLAFASSALLVPLTGCELLQALYQTELEFPIPLETPAADLDATTQFESVERSLCNDPDAYNCLVVKALDATDDGEISDPPTIPDEFPVSVTLVNPDTQQEETVNAEEWAAEAGLADAFDFAQAIPVDLTESLPGYDPENVKSVTFADVRLNWSENSLTFNTVPLDLYVSTEALEDTSDADALIAEGLVQRVGTIPAQEAEVAGESPVEFLEGGEETFVEALRALKFTVVISLPDDATVGLAPGTPLGDGSETRRKPVGEATVSLKANLVYKVSAAEVIGPVEGVDGESTTP